MIFSFYSVENSGSGHPGDLAVMGVVMSGEHIEKSLSTLHSSHADAIGAPKVLYAHLFTTHTAHTGVCVAIRWSFTLTSEMLPSSCACIFNVCFCWICCTQNMYIDY